LALSAIVERPLIGVEAQRIFLDLRNHAAAYDLIQDVLPLTYGLHVGRDAGELIARSLTELQACGTVEEIDAVFADTRAKWSEAGFGTMLTTDKEGAWRRSQLISGLNTTAGHVVDVGNPNNGFGHHLLRVNPAVERVTGVDHRVDPSRVVGERLNFVHQDDETKIPLADQCADVVAFRVALHHMTKPVQEALLAEAARVVKPGGEILIIEDSWVDMPGLTDNALTMKFRALDDDDKIAALSLIDVSSCLMIYEKVAYPFSYRSAAEWENLLTGVGATSIDTTYWGFTGPLVPASWRRHQGYETRRPGGFPKVGHPCSLPSAHTSPEPVSRTEPADGGTIFRTTTGGR
jgi:ubiquinone/menaquinone biosynthesis C-methylase UbiE